MEKKVCDVNSKTKDIFNKLEKLWNQKTAGIIVSILFLLSLLPIIYVGLHNFASGDDYWYGVHTYRGWVEEGLLGALRGSLQTVSEFYENWQGTWFTMFLFTLSPNHFWENGYLLTVFIALGALIASFIYLADFYLVKKLKFAKGSTAAIVCLVMYLAIQYVPRTTSAFFWFNGVMHYIIPFFLMVLAIVHSHKYIDEKKKKDYIILFIAFTLLGGGSYLAPLAATLTVSLILIIQLRAEVFDWKKKEFRFSYDWKNLWILAALFSELAGLAVSFMSPGNQVRGGEEFGFSLKWAAQCIYYAIDRGIYLGEDFFLLNPVNTVVYLILAVIVWRELWRRDRERTVFRWPFIFVVYMNGIYWATYVPEIYSRSDVSYGVHNTYFHVFLIITLANIIYVHGWLQNLLIKYWEKKAVKEGSNIEEAERKSIFSQYFFGKKIMSPVLGVMVLLLIMISVKSDIMTTNDYCITYAESGRMKKYVEVRKEQHKILLDESILDAVIPEMEEQYPLLHMPLSSDIHMMRNVDRALYYNKNSVEAVKVE